KAALCSSLERLAARSNRLRLTCVALAFRDEVIFSRASERLSLFRHRLASHVSRACASAEQIYLHRRWRVMRARRQPAAREGDLRLARGPDGSADVSTRFRSGWTVHAMGTRCDPTT